MREVNQIIVHSSATRPDQDVDAAMIRRWHLNRGWSDIGYHYVIKRNGLVELGRDLDGDGNVNEEVGAHAFGFNQNSIGICMIGGVNNDNVPEANFTLKQYNTLYYCVSILRTDFPNAEIIGHKDVSSTACPSFDVKSLLSCQTHVLI